MPSTDTWGSAGCVHVANGTRLARYLVECGGLPWDVARDLQCPDVHLFSRLLMRSNCLAAVDRKLLEVDTPGGGPLPFTRRSVRLAYVLGVLSLLTVLGFCGFLAGLLRAFR